MRIPRRFLSQPDTERTGFALSSQFPCPCCGYRVFEEHPGSYDICAICGWEDDISQLRFPHSLGANRVSLIEAQMSFADQDADDLQNNVARATALGKARDPGWRCIDEAMDDVEQPTSSQPGLKDHRQ
jgi:Cysteine-rich CPCC